MKSNTATKGLTLLFSLPPSYCFFFTILFISSFCNQVHGSNQGIFSYDNALVNYELTALSHLEEQISNSELISNQNFDVDATNFASVKLATDDDVMGIPSFAWGFCCGISGVVIVYVSFEDEPNQKEEIQKAIKGFVTSVGTFLAIYIALIIAVSGTQ